ncbi:MAG: hypothetical protein R3B83_02725 [Nitrospirales bacterium]
MVANTHLEGTYSEVYPNVSQDLSGMKKLFKQFSFPGGILGHVAPKHPVRSMKAGNWDMPSLTHSGRSDNPDLIVACVIGDGEAETGPWLPPGIPINF